MTYEVFIVEDKGKKIVLNDVTTLVEACERASEMGCDHVEIATSNHYWFFMWQDPEDFRLWEGNDDMGNQIIIRLRRGMIL